MQFEGLEVRVPRGFKETLLVTYPEGLYEREIKYRPVEPPFQGILDTRRSYRDYTRRYTDLLTEIDGKKVFFFGAGDSLRIFLERFGEGLDVVCAFDNAKHKWGATAYGVPVRSPVDLPSLLDENFRLIIVNIYYEEIGRQLEKLGVKDYYVFIDGWDYRKDD
jgi:lipopolysaccharide cholinephosphotransferase